VILIGAVVQVLGQVGGGARIRMIVIRVRLWRLDFRGPTELRCRWSKTVLRNLRLLVDSALERKTKLRTFYRSNTEGLPKMLCLQSHLRVLLLLLGLRCPTEIKLFNCQMNHKLNGKLRKCFSPREDLIRHEPNSLRPF